MQRVQFQKEYLINASDKIIYQCLSTPSGLAEWFADDVNVKGNIYTFFWEGESESAELLNCKNDQCVKFRWTEDPDAIFEMRIKIDDLTGDVAIVITDMVEDDDVEDAELLWDKNMENLRHALGS
jgi:uncharacterized protein YndB with AHSA1/START domain